VKKVTSECKFSDRLLYDKENFASALCALNKERFYDFHNTTYITVLHKQKSSKNHFEIPKTCCRRHMIGWKNCVKNWFYF